MQWERSCLIAVGDLVSQVGVERAEHAGGMRLLCACYAGWFAGGVRLLCWCMRGPAPCWLYAPAMLVVCSYYATTMPPQWASMRLVNEVMFESSW